MKQIGLICGSMRFRKTMLKEFEEANALLYNHLLLIPPVFLDDEQEKLMSSAPNFKQSMIEIHIKKMLDCDFIYVIDCNDGFTSYIGDGTRYEIAMATALGKPVYYKSDDGLAKLYNTLLFQGEKGGNKK